VADNTWVSITADNGPEVNPSGGQGTGNYKNPGRTGGLRGRKRDATEGGTREIGLIEYPPAVKANRVEMEYPVQTTDVLATMLDILGMESFESRPLDGMVSSQAIRSLALNHLVIGVRPFTSNL
jgi:arylsulfatase A-like enzyme